MIIQFLPAKQKFPLSIMILIFFSVYANAQTNVDRTISVEKKEPSEMKVLLSSKQHLRNKFFLGRHRSASNTVQLSVTENQENEQEDFSEGNKSRCLQPPKVQTGFEGNPQTPFFLPPVGYYASESSIAISNAGKIVSISNGWIRYYDEKGRLAFSDSLYHFCSGLINTRVMYDPKKDRFVFVSLYGVTDFSSIFSTEGSVVGFSKSNNPLDGWHFYYFSDAAVGDGLTADYPQLTISDDEIFYTNIRLMLMAI